MVRTQSFLGASVAVVLLLLAIAMVAIGAVAGYIGYPIIPTERGWTMVLGGTIAASSGLLLFGIAVAAHRLGRIVRALTGVKEGLARVADQATATSTIATQSLAASAEPWRTRDSELPSPDLRVVGQYASGGNSYVMYSDGSIHSDTPTGHRRFNSLEELRAYVANGEGQPPVERRRFR